MLEDVREHDDVEAAKLLRKVVHVRIDDPRRRREQRMREPVGIPDSLEPESHGLDVMHVRRGTRVVRGEGREVDEDDSCASSLELEADKAVRGTNLEDAEVAVVQAAEVGVDSGNGNTAITVAAGPPPGSSIEWYR